MNWRTDIEAMPKGGMVETPPQGARKAGEVWRSPLLIVALNSGEVITTRWLPPEAGERKEGRWRGLNPGTEPVAWMSWPVYPS
jgi:hypothetical protein